jgi:UDP-2,3-diacylglucosamine pyrophosphatase LpxH
MHMIQTQGDGTKGTDSPVDDPVLTGPSHMLDAVILSDIHLGSANCQAKRVCDLLERIVAGELLTSRLILNGDVFDSIDFRRLHKSHWRVLSLIRKLSDQIEIVWLCGNHDGSAEIVSHLLGVRVQDEYVLPSGQQRLLILHGHIFDEFIVAYPWLTWLADQIYRFLQWIDRTHSFAKTAKRGSKTFLRCAKKIADGAVDLARKRECTGAICGHTHAAVAQTEQLIPYYNSGCWTELPCNYLTVRGGVVELHDFTVREQVAEPAPIPEVSRLAAGG